MLFRSLRSFLQSHTPFFLMMILCIMISSLLMLFGYGLYQDYMLEQKSFNQSTQRFTLNANARSEDMERDGLITVIRPMNPMEVHRIEKDTVKLEHLYEEGFKLGEEFCTRNEILKRG